MMNDLLNLVSVVRPANDYGRIRNDVYSIVSRYKAPRYLKLTDRLSMLFEDAVTVWFQIEETIHMEDTDDEQIIKEIIKTYQPMIPNDDEITFTLFVHVYNDEEMRTLLPKYNGIERSTKLLLRNELIDAVPIYPQDYGPDAQVRSMHYLKYRRNSLSKIISDEDHVEILVDHPQAKAKVRVPADTLASLRKSIGIKAIKWLVD